MIARLEWWFEELFQRRWFERLLIASVIYAGLWLYLLPRGGVFDMAAYMAVILWAGVFLAILGGIALAIGRAIKEHFMPWDGHMERRLRERRH